MADDVDKYEQFAVAYGGEPSSPTYKNATKSYQLVFPEASVASARRGGSRYLKDPHVKAAMRKFQDASLMLAAHTTDELITRSFKREDELFKEALLTGDSRFAVAASRYMEMGMKAAGMFIIRTEDITPGDRKFPLGKDDLKQVLKEHLARMDRLDQPNPMPRSPEATARVIPEAEYSVIDESTGSAAGAASSASDDGSQDVRRVAGLLAEAAAGSVAPDSSGAEADAVSAD